MTTATNDIPDLIYYYRKDLARSRRMVKELTAEGLAAIKAAAVQP